jgi:hypothetical protein
MPDTNNVRAELAAHILNGLFPSMVSSTGMPTTEFARLAEHYAEKAVITADALLRALDRAAPRTIT